MTSRCHDCGEHRWSHDGYCLSVTCAGSVFDPDWPATRPKDTSRPEETNTTKKPTVKKARKPRKGALRTEELWYESRGETPPWKIKHEDHA